jgi:hypothetical protein
MIPFDVTIPATVPQGSEIPEGLMNNPVYIILIIEHNGVVSPENLRICYIANEDRENDARGAVLVHQQISSDLALDP